MIIKQYILDGYVVVTDWYSRKGYVHLRITTDEEGLKRIKENPLQDYIGFGTKDVDYAYFNVYLKEIESTEKYRRETYYYDAIETIEAGDDPWIENNPDYIFEVLDSEAISISY